MVDSLAQESGARPQSDGRPRGRRRRRGRRAASAG
jgi:hypothetical protein